jgi:thiamine transport system substrate-binding protein
MLLPATVAACGDGDAGHGTVTLTLLTHDSFLASEGIFDTFTAETGIGVTVVPGNDAGEVLAKAVLTAGSPEGDVLWGVDNTLLSRAISAAVFEPYASPLLSTMDPAVVALVPGHEATPVDTGDVCVNYDIGWFAERGIDPPRTLADLTRPEYRDLLVVQNPATSSPGLAFQLATVAAFGEDGWQQYWADLRANGVEVVDGWTEAYTVRFSGSSGRGPRPLVVSYASSPPAEVVFADPPRDTAPTAVMVDGCFRQVEFAGILRGSDHVDEARRLVDFLASRTFQEDMPLNMFVYPVNRDAALPDVFERFSVVTSDPLSVAPDRIAERREAWVDEWTTIVLR